MKIILLSVLLAGLALASTEVKAIHSAPEGVDLVKFPIVKDGGLTPEKTADLGLASFKLKESVKVLNHYRGTDTWTHDTLEIGDTVYKDQTGEILYRAKCSNRVKVLKNCPAPTTVLQAAPAPKKELDWLDNMAEKFAKGWRDSTGAVGRSWGVLLPILLLLLFPLAGLGWWLYRRLRPVPPPPAPPAPPAPPVATAYRRSPSTLVHPPPTGLGPNQRM